MIPRHSLVSTQHGLVTVADTWTETEAVTGDANKEETTAMAALFEGIDVTSRVAHFEPVLFLMRRTVVAALLVYLPGSPLAASLGLFCTTLAMLAFTAAVRPYKERAANNLAIVNELFIGVFILLVLNGDTMHGFVLIAFIVLVVFVNLTSMIGTAYLNFQQSIHLCEKEAILVIEDNVVNESNSENIDTYEQLPENSPTKPLKFKHDNESELNLSITRTERETSAQ